MKALAPGKVILSGEHAVVYGAPALALAVRCHAHACLRPASGAGLYLRLADLDCELVLAPDTLPNLRHALEAKHRRFLQGTLSVDAILQHPSELFAYAIALVSERLACRFDRLHVDIVSSIPQGAGMGSSAATVAALMQVLAHHRALVLDSHALESLTTQAEQLQHGRSSGLDPAVVSRGGLLRYEQGVSTVIEASLPGEWYLIDSGQPAVTTGEVVAAVRQSFSGSAIWSEFRDLTQAWQAGLLEQSLEKTRRALVENQRLLQVIGVVPPRVSAFVRRAAGLGAVVKVCGAGAHRGEAGGMLLWQGPEPRALCAEFGYGYRELEEDRRGARCGD